MDVRNHAANVALAKNDWRLSKAMALSILSSTKSNWPTVNMSKEEMDTHKEFTSEIAFSLPKVSPDHQLERIRDHSYKLKSLVSLSKGWITGP
jgi:hypothetical protein